ncbi:MAG: phage holin, lambda family [Aeromonas sp.]
MWGEDLSMYLGAWFDEHWPAVYGFGLAVSIAYLRVAYAGGARRQRLLEALLCGAISLAVMSAMGLVGIPAQASGFVGGAIGFLGVEQIRSVARSVLARRFDHGKD